MDSSQLKRRFVEAHSRYRTGLPADADLYRRQLYLTPCLGAYGIAAYVVALNGSPPRALYCLVKDAGGDLVHVLGDAKRRAPIGPESVKGQPVRQALLALVDDYEDDAQRIMRQAEAIARDAWDDGESDAGAQSKGVTE